MFTKCFCINPDLDGYRAPNIVKIVSTSLMKAKIGQN